MMSFLGITSALFAQQYDMSYMTFKNYIKEEMTEKEFRSVDEYFEGNISGLVCFYDYGDFSGDTLDEFVVLTHEDNFEYGQKINVYIFRGTEKGSFEFVDKVTYPYWKSRYEVAILIKRGVLFVTSTDRDYENWKWTVYKVEDERLKQLREENYQ
jgi:hypothetical protein